MRLNAASESSVADAYSRTERLARWYVLERNTHFKLGGIYGHWCDTASSVLARADAQHF